MDRGEIVQALTKMLDDSDGILVQIGARAEFNQDAYENLINLLVIYNDLIHEDTCIDRHIAGCLFALDSALQGLVSHFQHLNHPALLEVSRAHAEIIDIIGKLMPS